MLFKSNNCKHKRTAIVLIAFLSILMVIFVQPLAAGVTGNFVVTHDDVIKALEGYLAGHEVYSTIPYRIYSKRQIDDVTRNTPIEVKIFDRTRSTLLRSDNFQVVLMSDGKTIRRFELRGFVGIEVPVGCVNRDVKRGEVIDNALEFAYRDLTNTPVMSPVYENDDIKGLVLKVNLRTGREIDRNLLEQPNLVFKNDRVIVFFESDGLSITMVGTAMRDAKLGERVDVLNERSGNIIRCVVTGEGEVETR
jgi:flagella basal body P-ring formation protein FlgA